ncbi:testis-specific protein TEX28 isoform X2 [Rhinoderma darwinii]
MVSNEKKETKHDHDTANGENYEDRTSETINLLSVNQEDDDPSTGVKWSPLKDHKKVILYQWTGLSKKPNFLKKMAKTGKEEKKAFVSKVKKSKIHQNKTEDACPGVSHDKMSRLNHMMESLKRRSSKTAVNKAASCPVVGSLPENRQSQEWLEDVSVRSYFMQKTLDLSELLHVEKTSQLENRIEYLHLLPKSDQPQAAQIQLQSEKGNHLIAAEVAHLELCQKKLLELEQGHLSNPLSMASEDLDGENVDLQSADGLQNPLLLPTSSQEPASNACAVHDMAPYFYYKDPSLAWIPSSSFVETSSLAGEIPITPKGSLDRRCCNIEPLMKEITAVKYKQDFLEKECLQLRSRYLSDNSIIMELLREQHLRYSHLLVHMNDLREQQNAEIENMKEVILFMEEKMAYQSYERARDIWDEMGLFQSRLSKIEAEQKPQNSPESVDEANSSQIFYSKVMNLLPIIVTNTRQILYGKVMMKCLLVIVTVLLICLSAVSLYAIPLVTTPLYTITPLIIVALSHGVSHNWGTLSVNLQRSWVVTHVTLLFNRIINDYDFMMAIQEAWELFLGG